MRIFCGSFDIFRNFPSSSISLSPSLFFDLSPFLVYRSTKSTFLELSMGVRKGFPVYKALYFEYLMSCALGKSEKEREMKIASTINPFDEFVKGTEQKGTQRKWTFQSEAQHINYSWVELLKTQSYKTFFLLSFSPFACLTGLSIHHNLHAAIASNKTGISIFNQHNFEGLRPLLMFQNRREVSSAIILTNVLTTPLSEPQRAAKQPHEQRIKAARRNDTKASKLIMKTRLEKV